MSLLEKCAFVGVILLLILVCGWLVQRPIMIDSRGSVATVDPDVKWLFVAVVIGIVALAATGVYPGLSQVSLFILIGGPIAFYLGFTSRLRR